VEEHFEELAGRVAAELQPGEAFTATYSGEESDFARLNDSQLRQAGHVSQRQLQLDLIEGRRHASGEVSLTGSPALDRERARNLVAELRASRVHLPEDPHFLFADEPVSTRVVRRGALPEPDEALDAIASIGLGRDLVGIFASGSIQRGFASSTGQRNWFESESHHLDWSFHGQGGAAVKCSYAGETWCADVLRQRADTAAEQLVTLKRPPRSIDPGRFRVYLAPAALWEIFDILAWGGFGLRAHRTKVSPLLRMSTDDVRLHARIGLREHTAEGIAPNFEAAGFLRPDAVNLIEAGRFQDCLVSPRSSVEFDTETNGAAAAEAPLSLDLEGGCLAPDAVLSELGTGLFVGNLWYLNYSDRNACRATGMTRFATFWVERGQLVAPVPAMRFDESVYRMLGDGLVDLTRDRELLIDANTYSARSTRSARLPGALIDELEFTL
jgi:predicted Zn-dependent protease